MNDNRMEARNKFQPVGRSKVIKESILSPHNAGLRFVLSINNTLGKTDDNPLYPLFSKKWKKVKEEARGWFTTKTGAYKLGAINTTAVQSDTWVIHMLCQNDELQTSEPAIVDCLKKICTMAKYEKASIHVSSILTEAVPELKPLLDEHLIKNGVSVYLYEEPSV